MASTIIHDVHTARNVKTFVSSVDVNYDNDKIKDTIFTTDDDVFLFVKKKIGSTIVIMDVKVVDDAFIDKIFFEV